MLQHTLGKFGVHISMAPIVPFNRLGRCYALEQVATPTGRSPLIGADKIKTEISRYIQKRKLQNSCKIYNCRIGNDLGVRVTGSNAQLIEILKTESNERKESSSVSSQICCKNKTIKEIAC
jgi:hypothetical protein